MRDPDLLQQWVQMGILVWHLHMAPEMKETSPSFRRPRAELPTPAPQSISAAQKEPHDSSNVGGQYPQHQQLRGPDTAIS